MFKLRGVTTTGGVDEPVTGLESAAASGDEVDEDAAATTVGAAGLTGSSAGVSSAGFVVSPAPSCRFP